MPTSQQTRDNRLPVTVRHQRSGIGLIESSGGLASGLHSYLAKNPGAWVGWPGLASELLSSSQRQQVIDELAKRDYHPVFLTRRLVTDFYLGFANRALWPLAHYFTQYPVYSQRQWQAYQQGNELFTEQTLHQAKPDDLIWVHDYHLLLAPEMLRRERPGQKIGFFLHIPFPEFEVFRQLPWRTEVLAGLLGADVIGFHTEGDRQHFADCLARLLGLGGNGRQVLVDGRVVTLGVYPMGIDSGRFASAGSLPAVRRQIAHLRRQMGERHLILSLDRLDYSKGIPRRLEAYGRFLKSHREWHGKVTLVAVTVPSRQEVTEYESLRRNVAERVGEINGQFGTLGWVPIWYLHRSVPFELLCALYRTAEVALVTPLRDGMNLVAKEYVASQENGQGVLILSETAGAAAELDQALIVNPFDLDQVAAALATALAMPEEERRSKNAKMQRHLAGATVESWAESFLADLKRD